ncbi:MAG: hypothetical protein HZC37_13430 [Burkholderiales bacterium]|nr:hypothetical protein [Burkholderiales bacterium]
MADLKSTPLHQSPQLVALWPFVHAGQPHIGLIERNEARTRSTLLVARIGQGPAQTLRRIDNDDVGVRGADALVQGDELAFVLEVNHGWPLQLARTRLAPLLEARSPAPEFADLHELHLGAAEAASVKLDPSDQWNVADLLAPRRWLFSPRWVLGAGDTLVIANTADGQAVLLDAKAAAAAPAAGASPLAQIPLPARAGTAAPAQRPPAPAATPPAPPLPNAAEPQALMAGGQLHRAFLRAGTAYRPFWSLPRYGRGADAGPRRLLVSTGASGAVTDLSAAHGLGALTAFALAAADDGQPWLFAMHAGKQGPEIAVLRYQAAAWTSVAQLRVDTRGDQLAVQQIGRDWHLVWAEPGDSGHTLRHARWAAP